MTLRQISKYYVYVSMLLCTGTVAIADDAVPAFNVELPAEAVAQLGVSRPQGDNAAERDVDVAAKIREYGSDALATEARRSQVRRWAEAGHVDAQLALGRAYSAGTHVGKDTREAIRWYQAAAEQGNAAAQSRLAHLLMGYDDTAVRNVPMALKWQRKASDAGLAAGIYQLWNIHAAITPQTRYRFNADDVAWLERQLTGGKPAKSEANTELSRCHSAASKRIVECYTYVPANGCDLVGCVEAVDCRGSGPYGRCDDRDYGPYGESGTFYCDPNNSRNVDFDRNVVIRDACNGEFDP